MFVCFEENQIFKLRWIEIYNEYMKTFVHFKLKHLT